jgi:hypothetical protein
MRKVHLHTSLIHGYIVDFFVDGTKVSSAEFSEFGLAFKFAWEWRIKG